MALGNQEPPLFPDKKDQYLQQPLPSDETCERTILGAILLDNSVINEVSQKLLPEDFYSSFNREVFSAMLELDEIPEKSIDPILIGNILKKRGSLEVMGGVAAITNLSFGLPHFSSVSEYVTIVKDSSIARKLIRANNLTTVEALSGEESVDSLLEAAEARLTELRDGRDTTGFVEVSGLATASVNRAHQVSTSGSVLTGISTGFIDLDSMLLGFNKKDLIILAGRPSMGKTALGLTFAQNAAIRGGATVAVFSLEMSKEQLVDRLICSEARIDSTLYRVGQLDSGKWDRVEAAREAICNSKIFIDDTPAIGPAYMRPRLRRLKATQGKVDLIVVDYLQLMEDGSTRMENRQQEITKISRRLKGLAKEFDAPVVALSQLNRNPEGRSSHRPIMSDLRESGSIEQDADVVMFIYRDDYYNETSEIPGVAEIIIAKQRQGPVGSKNLAFDRSATRFDNLGGDF